MQIAVTKKGDTLIFDNDGTAPQDGAMNATYSGWRGSVMVAINELLSWDQYFAVGGALRHIVFDPVPGTLNCADFPASVSTAPTQSMEISLYPAYNIISKMLYSDEQLRQDSKNHRIGLSLEHPLVTKQRPPGKDHDKGQEV